MQPVWLQGHVELRDGGRLSAGMAVLEDISQRHKPAKQALKDWGDGARFAGAKDRAFVSGLVLDALRRRRSLSWMMGDDSARAQVLGAMRFLWNWPLDRVAQAAADAPHGPGALTLDERERLEAPFVLAKAPAPVRGDYPDWLDGALESVFGAARASEMAALAERAPVDLRVNSLKADRDQVLASLAMFGAQANPISPLAVRIPPPAASERAAPVEIAPAYALGWFEVQDAGSQLAAGLAEDIAGKRVLDFCAGGGGKTLALAAAMAGEGEIFAYDSDARRMMDIIPRAQRAGVTNLALKTPLDPNALAGLEESMDLVFVDAPCTGSGTWRRRPDAKWRLSPDALARRIDEQNTVLAKACRYVRPGGRLIYVTCSVLPQENEERIEAFRAKHRDFAVSPIEGWNALRTAEGYLRLTPRSAGTDGFFAAVLRRRAG